MAYEMNQLLEAMIENGASDLHIRVGRSPSLRVNGEIVSIDATEHLPPEHGGYLARNWRRRPSRAVPGCSGFPGPW